jgi:transposase
VAKARLVQIEQEHHSQAFEAYHQLGPKRSHKAVAEQLGVSVASVKNWSRSFRWQERIAERDAQIARKMASRNRLVRLESFLREEPESRQEVIIHDLKNKSDQELRDILKQEIALLRDLSCSEDADP